MLFSNLLVLLVPQKLAQKFWLAKNAIKTKYPVFVLSFFKQRLISKKYNKTQWILGATQMT